MFLNPKIPKWLKTFKAGIEKGPNNTFICHCYNGGGEVQHITIFLGGSSQLVSGPPFISHLGRLEGEQPYLGDFLTMVTNHLLTCLIVQVLPDPCRFVGGKRKGLEEIPFPKAFLRTRRLQ